MTGGVAAHVEAAAVERVFREAYGQAVATLVRIFGDITLAEDAVQEAFVVASDRWRSDRVPPTRRDGSLRRHGTARSMISAVRPVVGRSTNSWARSQPQGTARAPRRWRRTDP